MMTEKQGIWLSGILEYIHTNSGLSWSDSIGIAMPQTHI